MQYYKILELVSLNLGIIGHGCLRAMGRHTRQRTCPKVNHMKFKTNSRLKQFKVDKARNIKQSSQSSLKVQSLDYFQKWNILSLGGAEVKYLPITPEGALFI